MSLIDSASLIVTPNAYSEGKLYSVIPSDGSGDMSVVRATTATRVNSAGLVELVPYNLLRYSEQFDNAVWAKANSTITSNATTAPNGTLTAEKMAANGTLTSSFFYLGQGIGDGIVGQSYTATLYAKAGTVTQMMMYLGAQNGVYWNLSNGQFISYYNGVQNITAYNSESMGDGWYRYTISINATITTIPVESYSAKSGNLAGNYTTADNYYIWGAQLVEGSTAKDYQKTETRLNIPRLDYSNGTCPSLLVEPQRTNVLDYSSSFNSGFWLYFLSTVTGNTTTSPSGVQDADTLTSTATTGGSVYRLVNTSGTQTISCFFKAGTSNVCNIGFSNGWYAEYNLSNQTFTTVGTVTASMEDYGNGWYRCIITANTTSTLIAFGNSGTTGTTVYIWGAQAEIGSYPTSYIPTTSASVTRNADVISKTGISSLIGQTEGVMFQDIYIDDILNAGSYYSFLAIGTTGNLMFMTFYPNGRIQFAVYNGNVLQVDIDAPSYGLTSGRHKIAVAYKNNDFAFYCDGNLVGTDTSGSVPATSKIDLTDTVGGKQRYNAVALWKTRLTNDELERLTGTGFNTYAEMANYYNYITQ